MIIYTRTERGVEWLLSPSFALCAMSAPNYPVAVDIISLGHTCNTLPVGEDKPRKTHPFSRNHAGSQSFHLLPAPRTVFHIMRVETDVVLDVRQFQDGAASDVLKPWKEKRNSFIRSEQWNHFAPSISLPAQWAKWTKNANNRSLHTNDTRRPFSISIH